MSHEPLAASPEHNAIDPAMKLALDMAKDGSNPDRTNLGDYTYALMKSAGLTADEAIATANIHFGSLDATRTLTDRILREGGLLTGATDGLAYLATKGLLVSEAPRG